MKSLTVITGARLHFGLLVRGEGPSRTYGGVGLMIDQPRLRLSVTAAQHDRIVAEPGTRRRLERLLPSLVDGSRWEVVVAEQIPIHAGFGSGTQIDLAVAGALIQLRGEPLDNLSELAQRIGRGKRSIIGTIGFEAGGLIAHGISESGTDETDPTRQPFPEEWRFVLVTPRESAGLSGEAESLAFHELPPMSDAQFEAVTESAREFLAAVKAVDHPKASAALFEYGRFVGRYFAPIQGDVFADRRMASLADELHAGGVIGVGQTSWGPTLFALCDSESMAESVRSRIRRSSRGTDCVVRIAAARNHGAEFHAG